MFQELSLWQCLMSKKGPNLDKGRCRVCHHRADLHYGGRYKNCCQKKLGNSVCGCVGLDAGADGDRKKGDRRGSKYRRQRHGLE
jgi:hypothetical protein